MFIFAARRERQQHEDGHAVSRGFGGFGDGKKDTRHRQGKHVREGVVADIDGKAVIQLMCYQSSGDSHEALS